MTMATAPTNVDVHLADKLGWPAQPHTIPLGATTHVIERCNVPTNIDDKVKIEGKVLEAYAFLTGWRLAYNQTPHHPVELIGVSVITKRLKDGMIFVTEQNEVVTEVRAALRDVDETPGRGLVSYTLFVTVAH